MRNVNIPEFRKAVVAIVENNRDKVTSFEHTDDYSIFTFCGEKFACEITLNDKWIGYDLSIDTPKKSPACGLVNDTDIYPIYGGEYEKVALEIYDDLIDTVTAIFEGKIWFYSDENCSYTLRLNSDATYKTRYWEAKKFLFWHYTSGWIDDNHGYSDDDIRKMQLKILK